MSHAIQLMDTRTCLPMARAKRDSVFMEGLSLPRSILLMVTLLTPLRSASCSWVSLASSRRIQTLYFGLEHRREFGIVHLFIKHAVEAAHKLLTLLSVRVICRFSWHDLSRHEASSYTSNTILSINRM